jgi:hypothetical protein
MLAIIVVLLIASAVMAALAADLRRRRNAALRRAAAARAARSRLRAVGLECAELAAEFTAAFAELYHAAHVPSPADGSAADGSAAPAGALRPAVRAFVQHDLAAQAFALQLRGALELLWMSPASAVHGSWLSSCQVAAALLRISHLLTALCDTGTDLPEEWVDAVLGHLVPVASDIRQHVLAVR